MIPTFYGNTPHKQAVEKIFQMRRDLNHIQNALHSLERRIHANTPGDQMVPEFSLVYNWCTSLMESLFAMTWASFNKAQTEKVIKDFENRFKTFTALRTVVLTGRP